MSDQRINSASTLTGCLWPLAATSRDGRWRCGLMQRAVALLLLGGMFLLAPLAFASPTDAGWIVGLYDPDCVSDAPVWVSFALAVVGFPAPLRDVRPPLIPTVTCCSRGPPAGHREHFPRPLLPGTVSRPFSQPIFGLLSSSQRSCCHRARYADKKPSVA